MALRASLGGFMPQVMDRTAATTWLSAAAWLRRHPGVFSPETFYKYLNNGTLPSVRAGKKFLVPDDLLERIITSGKRRSKSST
jgi:hypothetical protein